MSTYMKVRFAAAVILGLFLASPTISLAQKDQPKQLARGEGGANGGGGRGVGKDLSDFVMAEVVEEVDPKTLPGYQELVAPSLDWLRAQIPDFASVLELGLKSKQWLILDEEALAKKTGSKERVYILCPDSTTMIKIEDEPIACQDKFDVVISKRWFNGNTPENQGGLILHELVRFVELHARRFKPNEKPIRETDVQLLTTILSKKSFGRINDPVLFLHQRGFGFYMTAEIRAQTAEKIRSTITESCSGEIKPGQIEKGTSRLVDLSMSAQEPISGRNAFLFAYYRILLDFGGSYYESVKMCEKLLKTIEADPSMNYFMPSVQSYINELQK